MVILKKIRGSSLAEVLIASVLIMIVFVIATLILNNVFKGVITANDSNMQNRITELTYLSKHGQLKTPYYEDTTHWDIAIETFNNQLILEALHKPSNKTIRKDINDVE